MTDLGWIRCGHTTCKRRHRTMLEIFYTFHMGENFSGVIGSRYLFLRLKKNVFFKRKKSEIREARERSRRRLMLQQSSTTLAYLIQLHSIFDLKWHYSLQLTAWSLELRQCADTNNIQNHSVPLSRSYISFPFDSSVSVYKVIQVTVFSDVTRCYWTCCRQCRVR